MRAFASKEVFAALWVTPWGASLRAIALGFGCAAASAAAAQTPAPSVAPETSAPSVSEAPAPTAPRPFDGSLGGGLAEVRRLVDAGDTAAALAVAERLLAPDLIGRLRAWLERRSDGASERALELFDGPLAGPLQALGFDPSTPAERAEIHFARGVVLRRAERPEDAEAAQRLARGLGGEARQDAVYELGHIAFVRGETWRAEIPEIAGPQGPGAGGPGASGPGASGPGAPVPAAPTSPPGASGASGAGDDGPDPLDEARRAYTQALETFVERLRLDWRDADTRANVELVRRRLRELDELERQRQEQQDQQDQSEQGDPKDDSEQKPSDEKKDPQQEDGQQKQSPDEPQDPESPTDPEDPNQEGEQPESEEQPGEQPEGEEPQPENPEDAPQPTSEPQEGALTKEELQRLLQQLEARRERGAEVQQALRRRARGHSARDW